MNDEINQKDIPATLDEILSSLPGLYTSIDRRMAGGLATQMKRHAQIMQVLRDAQDHEDEGPILGGAVAEISLYEAVSHMLQSMHGPAFHRVTYLKNAAMMLACAAAHIQDGVTRAAQQAERRAEQEMASDNGPLIDKLLGTAPTPVLTRNTTLDVGGVTHSIPPGPPEAVRKELLHRLAALREQREMAQGMLRQADRDTTAVNEMICQLG